MRTPTLGILRGAHVSDLGFRFPYHHHQGHSFSLSSPKKKLAMSAALLLQAMEAGGSTGYDSSSSSSSSASSSSSSKTATERVVSSYDPSYQRFLVRSRVFSLQYSHLYTRRTQILRPVVLAEAQKRWISSNRVGEPHEGQRDFRAGTCRTLGTLQERTAGVRAPGFCAPTQLYDFNVLVPREALQNTFINSYRLY
jgi:hypothetical protein